jgi:hypothetical protein
MLMVGGWVGGKVETRRRESEERNLTSQEFGV